LPVQPHDLEGGLPGVRDRGDAGGEQERDKYR
jgi:hypothetical protein